MTRKKPKASQQPTEPRSEVPATGTAIHPTTTPLTAIPSVRSSWGPLSTRPPNDSSIPPLLICRNKHWRHISSYHGPWLTFPLKLLESLAHSNYFSPPPKPIDPAVLFDLVKIRRLIDDATSLTVRAANGTTSASLGNSSSSTNGLYNNFDAEILGLGSSRQGRVHATLSRERRHRMREHATQMLSTAYSLDEIAASVVTMQATSALENVAKYVLQRNQHDTDAQYVHFFHEKIPSLSMTECTSLDALNDIIHQRPTEPAPYRTRSIARMFKDDYEGAVRDCTDGLTVLRLYHPQHQNEQRDLILAKDVAELKRNGRKDARVDEKDQPSGFELQLLFHRGDAYLALACDQISRGLHGISQGSSTLRQNEDGKVSPSEDEKSAAKEQAQARKLVRTYAKRALRDYTSFLSHLDYTPGIPDEYTEVFLDKLSSASHQSGDQSRGDKYCYSKAIANPILSDALIKYEKQKGSKSSTQSFPLIPKSSLYKLNLLFEAIPPADLPPFPREDSTCNDQSYQKFSLSDYSEAVTCHPLLNDVLHSLLLCHALIQTSAKEHLRHAHMAARIARISDGYPIFLITGSTARSDWMEVLRQTKNWLGLNTTWDRLSSPILRMKTRCYDNKGETPEEQNSRIKNEVNKEALSDNRGIDEATLQSSPRAHGWDSAGEGEEKQRTDYCRTSISSPPIVEKNGLAHSKPKTTSHTRDPSRQPTLQSKHETKSIDIPITTGRADLIARWILEAPAPSSLNGDGKSISRKKKSVNVSKDKLRKKASVASSVSGNSNVGGYGGGDSGTSGLDKGVENLDCLD